MPYTVVGIGELLWDVFGDTRKMGGAPVNFAFHCKELGARGVPVSCTGRDPAGADLVQAVEELGLEVEYIEQDPAAPTGTVDVTLDAAGKPQYEIRTDVAWDYIRGDQRLERLAPSVDAVCFGSLAQRSPVSRETIQRFVAQCPEQAVRIFDVNLRQDFYSKERIEDSLRLANVLKVSDEELPILAGLFGLQGPVVDQGRALLSRFQLRMVAYTRGAEGSMLIVPGGQVDHQGCRSTAVDTVGAGDSYTATLCMGLLREVSLDRVIAHASRVAAFVCEQTGATPSLPEHVVRGDEIRRNE